ncbi:MAG: type II toxin-antitoxin system ParD family antitoxin [Deltaproteobacteria bacterium]|nr:type II toxin-antitoxin system ParD family antitoxin [Deltaproteobacteria bacterium]MBN2674545.1 type II toxin-antitoxin system ParD family antitoxin [Deltaproteobacteria bacterium]
MTMHISLPPQQEEKINRRVENGQYASASEVIQSALKLLDREEQLKDITLEELRNEIQIGLDQARRGETRVFDEAEVERLKLECRAEFEKRKANQL